MTNEEFAIECKKRENRSFDNIKNNITDQNLRLLHMAMGLCTEAGEIMDIMKKTFIYNKPLDRANFIEELGDIMWYIPAILEELGTTFEEVQQLNVDKLSKRYGDGFTPEKALNRDIPNELSSINDKFGN